MYKQTLKKSYMYKQTLKIRRHVLWRLIWVFTVLYNEKVTMLIWFNNLLNNYLFCESVSWLPMAHFNTSVLLVRYDFVAGDICVV